MPPDRYAVIGNPVAHSKSPFIHAQFAQATAQHLRYERIEAPLDGFIATVEAFRAAGGLGCNVTVPFKQQAAAYATRLTTRAQEAQAANVLKFEGHEALGDNTDGAGLVADMTRNLGLDLAGLRVCIAGAGGATRGVVGPLLRAGVARLVIANRTPERATQIAEQFAHQFAQAASPARVHGCSYAALQGEAFDILINATSASLAGETTPLPLPAFDGVTLAYDMMYGQGDTPFMSMARARGVARVTDGLGMLVEQAAESFMLWRAHHGPARPDTGALMQLMRAGAA
jgi:shikimate dehydrogenase